MKSKQSNWLKHVLQWGVLAAIAVFILFGAKLFGKPTDVEAYCPFGGLQAFGSYLANNSLACSMSLTQIMIGIVLAVGVILFSKLFCGYLCPLGTVGEYMSKGGKKVKMNYVIAPDSVADKMLRIIKYALLFIIFYMSVSSSELFCKNLDPYYAVATGFKGEITAWMVMISIVVLFLGNFFINMFWCKYICPLGAISNIFKFTLLFIGIVALVWILGIAGLASGWVWALGAACLIGYIFEITCMKTKTCQLLHITRNEETCTKCKLCTKKCPYNIPVHETKTVKHVDCTLCGNCISACGEKSLTVSKKKSLRWLPGILVVVLFALALVLGRSWELPTIDEKWGDYEKIENLQTFEMEGLTSVKCFGSSKAFSAKMQKVSGIYGVKTFVKRHAVVILYDPAVMNPEAIQKELFTATKMKFKTPPAEMESLNVIKLGVEGLFEKMDMIYLGNILRGVEGIYGFDAEFACPVEVRLFVDPNVEISKKALVDSIQVKNIYLPVKDGGTRAVPVKFEVKSYEDNAGTISRTDFIELMFASTRELSGEFKENTAKWGGDEFPKAVYEFEYPAIEKTPIQLNFRFFKSFLSTNEGITRVDVLLKDGVPTVQITYVASMWNDQTIWEKLFNAPVWTISYQDGTVKEEEPKLKFTKEGHTIK